MQTTRGDATLRDALEVISRAARWVDLAAAACIVVKRTARDDGKTGHIGRKIVFVGDGDKVVESKGEDDLRCAHEQRANPQPRSHRALSLVARPRLVKAPSRFCTQPLLATALVNAGRGGLRAGGGAVGRRTPLDISCVPVLHLLWSRSAFPASDANRRVAPWSHRSFQDVNARFLARDIFLICSSRRLADARSRCGSR